MKALRDARGTPPVRYRDSPKAGEGPFSMPIRGPDCLPFDREIHRRAQDALEGFLNLHGKPRWTAEVG